jgi:adenosine deaminase
MKLDSIDHLLQDMTELHTHLSTSVSTHLLWELAHQQGITLPEKNYWKFMDMVTISGAVDYAKFHTFFDLNQMIQSSPMGVERSFYEAVGLGYRKCDIRYGEIKVNPMKRNKDGLFDLDKIIFSAIVGMQRAMMEYPVKGGVIIEMDRRFPLHMNEVIARKAISFAGKGVLGLDISGPTPA